MAFVVLPEGSLWLRAALWTSVLYVVALGVQLVAFTLQSVSRGRAEAPRGARSVIVLGCDLGADGTVTPLLASRLDRAVEVLDQQSIAGRQPTFVVSGGLGTSETAPEAVAMRRHLVSRGLDGGDIMVESSSRNTRENLVMSQRMLHASESVSEPTVVVTSDFHVLRTAAYARELGIDAHVTGARTPARYLPTAFLREFAATIRRYWRANAALVAAILLSVLLLRHIRR